jgi:hypothetical protein
MWQNDGHYTFIPLKRADHPTGWKIAAACPPGADIFYIFSPDDPHLSWTVKATQDDVERIAVEMWEGWL